MNNIYKKIYISERFHQNEFDEYINKKYIAENVRKNNLTTRTTLLIGIIAFLFNASNALYDEYRIHWIKVMVYILIVVYYIALAISFIYVLLAMFPVRYGFPPLIKDYNEIYKLKKKYSKTKNLNISKKKIIKKILNENRSAYSEIADNNAIVNHKRNNYLYRSYYPLVLAITLFVIIFAVNSLCTEKYNKNNCSSTLDQNKMEVINVKKK